MSTAPEKPSLSQRIDNDSGLKAKARMLTITSLLLMTVMVTGATIEEANTFIFKVVISNQSGVPAMMVIAIVFLMVRYYSYAKPHHAEVEKIWTGKLLRHPCLLTFDYHDHEPSGLIYELQPKDFGLGDPSFNYDRPESNNFCYRRGLLFSRYVDYEWERSNSVGEIPVNLFRALPFMVYLKILSLEYKYRIATIFANREYLDILGPYFVGLAGLISFFWRDDVQSFLNRVLLT